MESKDHKDLHKQLVHSHNEIQTELKDIKQAQSHIHHDLVALKKVIQSSVDHSNARTETAHTRIDASNTYTDQRLLVHQEQFRRMNTAVHTLYIDHCFNQYRNQEDALYRCLKNEFQE